MGFRIKFDIESDPVIPNLEDIEVPTLEIPTPDELPSSAVVIRKSLPATSSTSPNAESNSAPLEWGGWTLSLDLSNLETAVEGVDTFLQVVDKVSKVVAVLLKLLRLFTSDLFSLSRILKITLKVVVKQLKKIIEQLASTGLYYSVIGLENIKQIKRGGAVINGGYREFAARVSNTCLSPDTRKDPDAPRYGEKDQVGGAVFAMLATTNDPDLLSDMVHNMKILGNFFKFPPIFAGPALSLIAKPGFYDYEPSGSKKLGIKLTWVHPGTMLTKFFVYRSKTQPGVKQRALIDGEYKNFSVYNDVRETADEGMWEPVEVKVRISKGTTKGAKYSITDFNVEDSLVYYYKIYSSIGNKFAEDGTDDENLYDRRLTAPNATRSVNAVPRSCIPISELDKYTILDEGGNPVPPYDLEGDWNSVTIRSLLGKPLDKLFDLIDSLADKLDTIVMTGSDAMDNYIKFFEKKIKKYLDITNQVLEIIQRVLQYNLKGSFLLLNIPPEAGGMKGFVERFNSAELPKAKEVIKKRDEKGVVIEEESGSIADSSNVGIMFGVIMLYGAPTVDGDFIEQMVPEKEIAEFTRKLESAQKAKDTFLKLLGLG